MVKKMKKAPKVVKKTLKLKVMKIKRSIKVQAKKLRVNLKKIVKSIPHKKTVRLMIKKIATLPKLHILRATKTHFKRLFTLHFSWFNRAVLKKRAIIKRVKKALKSGHKKFALKLTKVAKKVAKRVTKAKKTMKKIHTKALHARKAFKWHFKKALKVMKATHKKTVVAAK